MMTFGLTGGLASGKSVAAEIFASLGATVIDADVISHSLTAPDGAALLAIRAALGDWAFAADGTFNRAAVRKRAFSESQTRRKLEEILHPMILTEIRKQMQNARGDYILLAIPLLLETGMLAADCRRIVVVDCAPDTQIRRAVLRGLDVAEAKKIIAAQLPRAVRNARADDIIENESDIKSLTVAVQKCHRAFLNLSEKGRQ